MSVLETVGVYAKKAGAWTIAGVLAAGFLSYTLWKDFGRPRVSHVAHRGIEIMRSAGRYSQPGIYGTCDFTGTPGGVDLIALQQSFIGNPNDYVPVALKCKDRIVIAGLEYNPEAVADMTEKFRLREFSQVHLRESNAQRTEKLNKVYLMSPRGFHTP